jgi:hypothetical protein
MVARLDKGRSGSRNRSGDEAHGRSGVQRGQRYPASRALEPVSTGAFPSDKHIDLVQNETPLLVTLSGTGSALTCSASEGLVMSTPCVRAIQSVRLE